MGREPVALLAASGLARETMAAIEAAGTDEVVAVLDDDEASWGRPFGSVCVTGPIAAVADADDAALVVCAGSGAARAAIVARLGDLGIGDERYASVVHPSASVPGDCRVGRGTILLARVVLTAQVTVGRHVVAMPGVVLTHDDVVEDFATLCAGVVVGGDVRIGRGAYLGMNSSVREHRTVGAGSVLGMGAALITDLPDGEVWWGVPARRRPADRTAETVHGG